MSTGRVGVWHVKEADPVAAVWRLDPVVFGHTRMAVTWGSRYPALACSPIAPVGRPAAKRVASRKKDCMAVIKITPPPRFDFPYHTIRKITAPEDAENEREVYCGYARAESFLPLPTDENVRDYLLDADRKRNRKTNVHREMFETLRNNPQNFSVLNGGITIVARTIDVDDKARVATLAKASIINGSQTQGVLRDWLEEEKNAGTEPFPVHVKFELIIAHDEDVIAQTSVARNFQNRVMPISILGRWHYLDEINESFKKGSGGKYELRKKETEYPSEDDEDDDDDSTSRLVSTEKVLQVITALVPPSLWHREKERSNPVKTYAYSAKAKCLREYQRIYEAAKQGKNSDPNGGPLQKEKQEEFKRLYRFYVEIAWEAWKLYLHWKKYPIPRIRKEGAVEREGGKVKEVNDGIVFPILAALSVFATNESGKWTITVPEDFSEKELADQAAEAFMEIADSHPWNMGKSPACYSYLYRLTSLFKKFSTGRQAKGGNDAD